MRHTFFHLFERSPRSELNVIFSRIPFLFLFTISFNNLQKIYRKLLTHMVCQLILVTHFAFIEVSYYCCITVVILWYWMLLILNKQYIIVNYINYHTNTHDASYISEPLRKIQVFVSGITAKYKSELRTSGHAVADIISWIWLSIIFTSLPVWLDYCHHLRHLCLCLSGRYYWFVFFRGYFGIQASHVQCLEIWKCLCRTFVKILTILDSP